MVFLGKINSWGIAVGACPGVGSWLLDQRLNAWEKHRHPVPAALAEQVLGEKLIAWVSPSSLTTRLAAVGYAKDGSISHDWRSQFIFDGEFEHLLSPVNNSKLDEEINQLFAEQMNWRTTQAYHDLHKHLNVRGSLRHNNVLIREQADLDRYFERYVRLAEIINKHGYKTRAELSRVRRSSMKRQWWIETGEQEVGVAIGPDGEVWRFGGGYHRTAIARNLGLDAMPVRVRLVHAERQKQYR